MCDADGVPTPRRLEIWVKPLRLFEPCDALVRPSQECVDNAHARDLLRITRVQFERSQLVLFGKVEGFPMQLNPP
jgi:hypothetical protein